MTSRNRKRNILLSSQSVALRVLYKVFACYYPFDLDGQIIPLKKMADQILKPFHSSTYRVVLSVSEFIYAVKTVLCSRFPYSVFGSLGSTLQTERSFLRKLFGE